MKKITLETIENMRDGHKKNCMLIIYEINNRLDCIDGGVLPQNNYRLASLTRCSRSYDSHISVVLYDYRQGLQPWDYYSNKAYFKNWKECFCYLQGYKKAFFQHSHS